MLQQMAMASNYRSFADKFVVRPRTTTPASPVPLLRCCGCYIISSMFLRISPLLRGPIDSLLWVLLFLNCCCCRPFCRSACRSGAPPAQSLRATCGHSVTNCSRIETRSPRPRGLGLTANSQHQWSRGEQSAATTAVPRQCPYTVDFFLVCLCLWGDRNDISVICGGTICF